MSDVRYFNFPVVLLQDFMTDSSNVLKNILHYAVYAHSLKLDYGDEMERLEHSLAYYGIPLEDMDAFFCKAESIYLSMPGAVPMTGINVDVFFSYFVNDKSEFEKICLLGFLAFKSIIGRKAYFKLDNKLWLSRMDGHPRSCGTDFLSKEVRKYSSEYMTKRIKNELKDNWGLKSYSRYTRGFYVSFELTLEDLVKVAEKNRKLVKEKQKRQEEKELVHKVLQELKTAV
ncbi:hypothetical protein ACX0HA_00330 [Flavobacterium hauense]